MRQALTDAGWHNYSLFLVPDGGLIGYVESEDLTAAQAAMAATEVNSRWQREMAASSPASAATSPTRASCHPEIFHLEARDRRGSPNSAMATPAA